MLDFVGMFKDPRDRAMLPEPRDSYRCKSCGWINCFRPAALSWRSVELKTR